MYNAFDTKVCYCSCIICLNVIRDNVLHSFTLALEISSFTIKKNIILRGLNLSFYLEILKILWRKGIKPTTSQIRGQADAT